MDVMIEGASLAALGNCTPSYFTQEGAYIPKGDADPALARVAAANMTWAGGINHYVKIHKILEGWRGEGNGGGLDIRTPLISPHLLRYFVH